MAGEEIAAVGTHARWESELEQSRLSAGRLLDSLARKVGAVRAANYVKTHTAREMAAGIEGAASRRPIYALAAAIAAGFLVGCILKRSMR